MADRELEATFAQAEDCIARNSRQMNEPIISHQPHELLQPPPLQQEMPVLPPLQAFDMPLHHHHHHPVQQHDQEVQQLIVPLQQLQQPEPHEHTTLPPFDPNYQEDFEHQELHPQHPEQPPYDVVAHVNLISEIVDHQMSQLAAISSHLQELRHHLTANSERNRSTSKKRKVQTEKGYKESISYKKYIAAVIATNRRIVTEKVRTEAAFEDLVVKQCEKYKSQLKDDAEKIDFVRRFVAWAKNKTKTVDWPEQ